MARRRQSRRTSRFGLLVAFGLIALALIVGAFGSLINTAPALAAILGTLTAVAAGGGIGLWVWWRLQRRERYLARVRTLNDLLLLTPTQFELAVGELLRAWGYRDVRHTGGGGDLAADLICRTPDGQRLVVVQCKRYTPGKLIGSPDVQKFIGMMAVHHRAQMGIFVTTSGYTQPALALARGHPLRMIDGNQLVTFLHQVQAQRQPA